jgi:predicted nucleic acid-binding protein
MIVVVDASAAMGIALNAINAEIIINYLHDADIVIAPNTYPSEICNVFWKYVTFSNLDPVKAQKGIDFCIDLVDDYIDTAPMWREVFAESVKYRHPVYDLFYLVLARRQNAILLTNDEEMKTIAKKMSVPLPENY